MVNKLKKSLLLLTLLGLILSLTTMVLFESMDHDKEVETIMSYKELMDLPSSLTAEQKVEEAAKRGITTFLMDIDETGYYNMEDILSIEDRGHSILIKLSHSRILVQEGKTLPTNRILIDDVLTEEDGLFLEDAVLLFPESRTTEIPLWAKDKAVRTYLRPSHDVWAEYTIAVRERGDGAVIFRPYLDKEDPFNYTMDQIESITLTLEQDGFLLQANNEGTYAHLWELPLWIGFVIGLSMAGFVLLLLLLSMPKDLLQKIINKIGKIAFLTLMIFLLLLGGALSLGVILKNILLLGFISVLPLITILWAKTLPYRKFLSTCGAVLGSLLVSMILMQGIVTGSAYDLGMQPFRGVNMAYGLTFFFYGIYGLYTLYKTYKDDILKKGIRGSMKPILIGIMGILVIAATFYILQNRSGNYGVIRISTLELEFRRLLDEIFYVRPRTKEFLIGIPCLVLLSGHRRYQRIIEIMLEFGLVIGLSSFFNTILHFHSPLHIIGARTVLGILLGIAVGLMLYFVGTPFMKWFKLLRNDGV